MIISTSVCPPVLFGGRRLLILDIDGGGGLLRPLHEHVDPIRHFEVQIVLYFSFKRIRMVDLLDLLTCVFTIFEPVVHL